MDITVWDVAKTYYATKPPQFPIHRLPLSQLVAVEAVVSAINSPRVKAKWPNDIIVDGTHKVGGILTKSSSMGSDFKLQFGIGINTRISHASTIPTELQPRTLESFGIQVKANSGLASAISKNIDSWMDDFDYDQFRSSYLNIWLHSNESVTIDDKSYKIIGIDDFGFLQVSSDDGRLHSVDPANNRYDMMAGMILQK